MLLIRLQLLIVGSRLGLEVTIGRLAERVTVSFIILLIFSFSVQIHSVSAISLNIPTGGAKNGPFIDKMRFQLLSGENERVLALLDDEADILLGGLPTETLEQLGGLDDIIVSETLRNGYGYLAFNCDKYPLNETALRRAFAFALDKNAISAEVWNGHSEPLDGLVPKCNPYSIEKELPFSYYSEDLEEASRLLDAAGFAIDSVSGFRTAPDGSQFDVRVEVDERSKTAIDVGEYAVAAFQKLNINAVLMITDFYEYLNRIYCHWDFDVVFHGATFNDFNLDWLADFWSQYADEPYFNIPRFRNATYDSWRGQLLYSTQFDDVIEAAKQMQYILAYQCPIVVCYENRLGTIYRNDRFEGIVSDALKGPSDWWTAYKARLKKELGGPFGGTLRFASPLLIDEFNFMVSCSCYHYFNSYMPWDSLMKRTAEGELIPWLAESYFLETHGDNPDVRDGYMRITFDILKNATWSDNMPLTAEDVAFTINFYRTSYGNPYGSDLRAAYGSDLRAAYAPSRYRAVFEFEGVSFWHLGTIGLKPILPKHVFVDYVNNSWQMWNPDPNRAPIVTSGPFNYSMQVPREYLEMTYNPNYFYGNNRTMANHSPTGVTSDSFMPMAWFNALSIAITGGSIAVIAGIAIMWKRDS